MAKNFDTEIREAFNKKYLKVFLRNTSAIKDIQKQVDTLSSVRTANITDSQSNNPTLTIYPNRVYSIEETQKEVVALLESYFIGTPLLTQETEIIEVQDWLSDYPASNMIYDEVIEKYKLKTYQRNALDDMRLTLETFLKEVLGNQKSLENQLPEVAKYQKEKGLSVEFINMFNKLLDYYAKYQNNKVKHNAAEYSQSEIDLIIRLTTAFMKSFV
ncbi:MAG: hypothetical protein LBL79_06105 [Prevotella sp.]|jgi:hypothetical protein|nr:hypothetical protein [Prevotella sp.]